MKIITKIFHLFLLLTVSFTAKSQSTYNDYINETAINRKAEICLDLNNLYIRRDIDSLKIVGIELMLEAAETKNRFAEAVAEWMLGTYQIRVGATKNGLENLKYALNFFEKKEDYTLISELYNHIGHGFLLLGEYDEAVISYRESLKQGELSPDETAIFNAELGLGRAYIQLGDTALAMKLISHYRDESIRLSKYEAASDALAYMGMIEYDRGSIELARELYLKSMETSLKSNSLVHLSHAQTNQAIVLFSLGKLDSSLHYFNESLRLRIQLNNIRPIIESYFNLGNYYEGISDTLEAERYYLISRKLSIENHFVADHLDAVDALLLMYDGNYDEIQLNLWQDEMDSLKSQLKTQRGVDDEILEYALSAYPKKEASVIANNNVKGIYIVPVLIICIVLVFFILKKRKNNSNSI